MDTIAISTLYVATFINAAMPGPCAVLAASRTARCGVRSGLLVSAGVVVGIAAVTGLAFGAMLGALTVSHHILVAMKWGGVLALVLFAARTLHSASSSSGDPMRQRSSVGNDFCAGAIIVLSSPFVLMFLLALLPQFVPSGASDFGPALLAACVFGTGAAATQAAAVLFGACSVRLSHPKSRWAEHVGAVLLIGFAGAAVITPVG